MTSTTTSGGRRRKASVPDLVARAHAGEVAALARLLTLVENDDPRVAEALRGPRSAPRAPASHVVGLTGAPGVGKSTTTSALIGRLRARGLRVAVLAVDPSSPFNGGALLGDRLRMSEHAEDPGVFVRSMAARGHLGGLATAAAPALRLIEAVGFDVVLVETVGVGQSEVEVAHMVDTTVVLLAPGLGDGIQAAKAGLIEAGDVYVVNKSDLPGAGAVVRDIRAVLRGAGGGAPAEVSGREVLEISAASGTGVEALAEVLARRHARLLETGSLEDRRCARDRAELEARAMAAIRRSWARGGDGTSPIDEWAGRVRDGADVRTAVAALLSGLADGPEPRASAPGE